LASGRGRDIIKTQGVWHFPDNRPLIIYFRGEGIMFGLGMPELLVIMVICVVLFGARRLPEIGAGLGKGIKNFKASLKEVKGDGEEKPEEPEVKTIKDKE